MSRAHSSRVNGGDLSVDLCLGAHGKDSGQSQDDSGSAHCCFVRVERDTGLDDDY